MQGYKYVGVISIALTWLAISFVLYKWPVLRSKSISKHVSAYKESYLLFAILTSVSLVLFYLFMFKWFIPVFTLPLGFKLVLIIGLILEFITVWIPDSTGLKHSVHNFTGYSAAFLLLVMTSFIVASPAASTFVKLVSLIATATMFSIFGFFLSVKSARQQHLIYQSVYIVSFHIAILVALFSVE